MFLFIIAESISKCTTGGQNIWVDTGSYNNYVGKDSRMIFVRFVNLGCEPAVPAEASWELTVPLFKDVLFLQTDCLNNGRGFCKLYPQIKYSPMYGIIDQQGKMVAVHGHTTDTFNGPKAFVDFMEKNGKRYSPTGIWTLGSNDTQTLEFLNSENKKILFLYDSRDCDQKIIAGNLRKIYREHVLPNKENIIFGELDCSQNLDVCQRYGNAVGWNKKAAVTAIGSNNQAIKATAIGYNENNQATILKLEGLTPESQYNSILAELKKLPAKEATLPPFTPKQTPAPTVAPKLFRVDRLENRTLDDILAKYKQWYHPKFNGVVWTQGSSECDPGTHAMGDKIDGMNRWNFYRYLAGVPEMTLDEAKSEIIAKAGPLQYYLNTITHHPSTNVKCYTQQNAETSKESNIASQTTKGNFHSTEAMSAFLFDPGANNELVGHRRNLLYPYQWKGAVSVYGPVGGNKGKAVTIVNQADKVNKVQNPYPLQDFISWPSAGYFPLEDLPDRWSISFHGFSKRNVWGWGTIEARDVEVKLYGSNGKELTISNYLIDRHPYGTEDCLVFTLTAFTKSQITPGYEVLVNVFIKSKNAKLEFKTTFIKFDDNPLPTPVPSRSPQATPYPLQTPLATPKPTWKYCFYQSNPDSCYSIYKYGPGRYQNLADDLEDDEGKRKDKPIKIEIGEELTDKSNSITLGSRKGSTDIVYYELTGKTVDIDMFVGPHSIVKASNRVNVILQISITNPTKLGQGNEITPSVLADKANYWPLSIRVEAVDIIDDDTKIDKTLQLYLYNENNMNGPMLVQVVGGTTNTPNFGENMASIFSSSDVTYKLWASNTQYLKQKVGMNYKKWNSLIELWSSDCKSCGHQTVPSIVDAIKNNDKNKNEPKQRVKIHFSDFKVGKGMFPEGKKLNYEFIGDTEGATLTFKDANSWVQDRIKSIKIRTNDGINKVIFKLDGDVKPTTLNFNFPVELINVDIDEQWKGKIGINNLVGSGSIISQLTNGNDPSVPILVNDNEVKISKTELNVENSTIKISSSEIKFSDSLGSDVTLEPVTAGESYTQKVNVENMVDKSSLTLKDFFRVDVTPSTKGKVSIDNVQDLRIAGNQAAIDDFKVGSNSQVMSNDLVTIKQISADSSSMFTFVSNSPVAVESVKVSNAEAATKQNNFSNIQISTELSLNGNLNLGFDNCSFIPGFNLNIDSGSNTDIPLITLSKIQGGLFTPIQIQLKLPDSPQKLKDLFKLNGEYVPKNLITGLEVDLMDCQLIADAVTVSSAQDLSAYCTENGRTIQIALTDHSTPLIQNIDDLIQKSIDAGHGGGGPNDNSGQGTHKPKNNTTATAVGVVVALVVVVAVIVGVVLYMKKKGKDSDSNVDEICQPQL